MGMEWVMGILATHYYTVVSLLFSINKKTCHRLESNKLETY